MVIFTPQNGGKKRCHFVLLVQPPTSSEITSTEITSTEITIVVGLGIVVRVVIF